VWRRLIRAKQLTGTLHADRCQRCVPQHVSCNTNKSEGFKEVNIPELHRQVHLPVNTVIIGTMCENKVILRGQLLM
jgi:hypothetical protein